MKLPGYWQGKGTISAAVAALALGWAAPSAHAGFVFFTLNNPARPGMQVTVAEQIVCVTPGACNTGNPNRVLDYQYYVVNTGIFPSTASRSA